MKITTEKIIRYYVEEEGYIFGGPFYTKQEAAQCLANYRANQKAVKAGKVHPNIKVNFKAIG